MGADLLRMSFVVHDDRYPVGCAHGRALLTPSQAVASAIARLLGVSRATIYKHIPAITATGLRPARQPWLATAGAR